jgi:hypothetical protein
MYNSLAAKLADRLGKKLAKRTPFRGDFVVADFRVLDNENKTAKILIQYDGSAFGTPSKEDVIGTVTHLFKAHDGRPRLNVDPGSITLHPRFESVSCVVRIPCIRRPYADVERFKLKSIVANTVFLGEDMTATWAVAKEGDSVFIERVEKDDIDKIIKERAKYNSFRSHPVQASLTIARVEASASKERLYSIGDFVKCSSGGKLKTGEILGLFEGGAQVRFRDGNQALVALASIHGLVKTSDESQRYSNEALKEYFRKAYGYSEEDLNKLVQYIP